MLEVQMFCEKCQVEIEKSKSANHKRWCGNFRPKGQFFKLCKGCNNSFETSGKRPRQFCSSECVSKYIMTPEVKEKISAARKKYLKENPEKHPWKKNEKFKSIPCERLKSVLEKEGIEFISEFQPLLNEGKFYTIDIVIPKLKIGIEINGEQHYNRDKTLKKYYRERHNEIVNAGWNLLEYHYSFCYKEEEINKLVHSLKNDIEISTYEFELASFLKKPKEKKAKKSIDLSKYEEVFSKLDLSSIGWIQKAATMLEVSHTHVRRVQRKYFSKLESFIRKCPDSSAG